MVDVQQKPLGAFQKDLLSGFVGFPQIDSDVHAARQKHFSPFQVRLDDGLGVEMSVRGQPFASPLVGQLHPLYELFLRGAADIEDVFFLLLAMLSDFLRKEVRIFQIVQTDAAAGDLVHVGRAYAAGGRADLVFAQGHFLGSVQYAVPGHDEVHVAADEKVLAVDADLRQILHLPFDQDLGVQHHAVSNYVDRPGISDAAWNVGKLKFLAVENDRMPGVAAALRSYDDVARPGEFVREFTLAFVAPGGAANTDHLFLNTHDYALIIIYKDTWIIQKRMLADKVKASYPASDNLLRCGLPP